MPIKKENYLTIRKHFIKLLGMKCAMCDVTCDDTGNYINEDGISKTIEFDHIRPNGTPRWKVSRSKREWEWFEAYDNSNLQLLCEKCNQKKSDN